MRALLITFCIITGLFGGGCAIMAGGLSGSMSNPLMLIPIAVFLFNLLVILAVLGWAHPWKPAFYTLAIVDWLIVAATVIGLLFGGTSSQGILPWGLALAGAFALKGYLTWAYVRTT